MNFYRVTYSNPDWAKMPSGLYPTGTFQNTEIMIGRDESKDMKDQLVPAIESGKPLVFGRDWEYTPIGPEQHLTIEADYYWMDAAAVAHFYRGEPMKGECIASVTHVLTVVKDDPVQVPAVMPEGVPWRPWEIHKGEPIPPVTSVEIAHGTADEAALREWYEAAGIQEPTTFARGGIVSPDAIRAAEELLQYGHLPSLSDSVMGQDVLDLTDNETPGEEKSPDSPQ